MQAQLKTAPPQTEIDEPEIEALRRLRNILQDAYLFSDVQIHAMHEAIHASGLDLTLRQG